MTVPHTECRILMKENKDSHRRNKMRILDKIKKEEEHQEKVKRRLITVL